MPATTPKRNQKRNSQIEKHVLPFLFDNPGATIAEVGVHPQYIYTAVADGLVKDASDDVKSGRRGRPAKRYKLTDKARKQVKRDRAKAEQVEAPAEPVQEPVAA